MRLSKRFLIFAGLTIFLFALYGLPFPKMGLDSDFFGVLQDARLAPSWKYFWQTSVAQMVYPLNEIKSGTCFSSFYRPIWQHLHVCEWYLFGRWWLGYVLGAIFFYGMIAGLLGTIFSYFYPLYESILLALLWAVHPSLSPSFLSVTVMLAASYFFIAFSALNYIWYFQQRGFIFYMFSLILYAIGALSYDLLIIAPMPLFFFLLFFHRYRLYEIIPFFMTTALCIGLRLFMMGCISSSKTFSIGSFLAMSIDNVIQALRPFWGLQFTSTLMALLVTLFFCFWVAYDWIFVKKDRLLIIWLLFSFACGSWGIIIGNSSSRYFALGLPFFILLLYILLSHLFSKKTNQYILLLLVFIGGWRTFDNFVAREQYTNARDIAMYEVLQKYPSMQYLFLVAPHFCKNEIFLLSSGLMQGLQLFSGNDTLRVYHIIDAPLCTTSFPSQGTIEVDYIDGGYRLRVTDEQKIWFMIPHGVKIIHSTMGKIVVNNRISSWQATDISVFLDSKYMTDTWLNETVVFSWDPSMWKFVSLAKDHLLKKETE